MAQPYSMWSWHPSVLIGIALLAAFYLAILGPLRDRWKGSQPATNFQIACFLSGLFVLFLALESPLDILGDEYWFTAHMTQHLLITLVTPPLLLLGTPGWLLEPLFRQPLVYRLARFLTAPLVAFTLFNLTFLAWHLPAWYETTLKNEGLHIFEHLLFISTGVINWWPVLSPSRLLPRLSPQAQILYLFLEAMPMTALAALIVFSTEILYPFYATAPRLLGLSALADQQIAGLVMGTPGTLIYLAALGGVFFSWLQQEESGGKQKSSILR